MKAKISIDLPTRTSLLAGLAPREVHPALVRAEEALSEAERVLAARRADLAARERAVTELPVRVHRGEARASAITDAMRERDAAALLIASAQDAVPRARARVVAETKSAEAAVQREGGRRAEQLERVAREVAPVLDELRELSLSLSRALDPMGMGFADVYWPCPTNCDVRLHVHRLDQGQRDATTTASRKEPT